MTNKKDKNKKKSITKNTAEFKPIIPNLFGNGQDYVISGKDKSITVTTPNQAVKHDQDKPDYSLMPEAMMEEVAKVWTFGKKKYAAHNWTKGFAWTRPLAAALRHIFAFMRGENLDPESSCSHLAHAICCLSMVIHFQKYGTGTDDRYIEPNNNEKET